MSDAIKAFTITICAGCRKMERNPFFHGGEEDRKQREDMAARGWRRKQFWPEPHWDKGPWFCSDECATQSYAALRAEAYWAEREQKKRDEEFHKYCNSFPTSFWVRNLVIFVVTFTVSFLLTRLVQC